jgi:hypothetical protein
MKQGNQDLAPPTEAEILVKRAFTLTMIGSALFVLAVFVSIW